MQVTNIWDCNGLGRYDFLVSFHFLTKKSSSLSQYFSNDLDMTAVTDPMTSISLSRDDIFTPGSDLVVLRFSYLDDAELDLGHSNLPAENGLAFFKLLFQSQSKTR